MKPFDHLFYIRITESCNLTCDHCFIPKNPKNMNMKHINGILKSIHDHTEYGQTILIQLHGGEPTLAGIKRIKTLINLLKGDSTRNYQFGIQTNLMKIDHEWIELYKEHFNSHIGVSWDYGIRKLHGSFDEFEKEFWNNLKFTTENKISAHLVITTTKPFMNWVIENSELFFDKLVKNGVESLQLERLTKVGWARENWSYIGLTNLEYSQYLSIFYTLHKIYVEKTGVNLPITPFDDLEIDIKKMLKGRTDGGSGCLSGKCDDKFHTIDANGYKVGCTALNSESDNTSINKDETITVKFFEPEEILEARKKRTESCENCTFNRICNTGCLTVTKRDVSGECSGAKGLLETIKFRIENENK